MTQLHHPSTCAIGATPKMLITVSLLATAKKRGFDLGGVVGRFLHKSSVYFFNDLSHSTALNKVARQV